MGSNGPRSAPWPPRPFPFKEPDLRNSSIPPSTASSNSGVFSSTVIAIVGILGAATLLVSYYIMVSKFCTSREVFRRGRRGYPRQGSNLNAASWPIFTRGLDNSVIQAIPVCKYLQGDGLVDGSGCAVCLTEFEEEDTLRLLPKCSHAFHISCIDTWLQSHSQCPLCRANIVSPTSTAGRGIEESTPTQGNQPQPEASNSAHLQHSSDQRSSESMVEARRSPNAHQPYIPSSVSGFMPEDGMEGVEAWGRLKVLNRENKIFTRHIRDGLPTGERSTLMGELRCFSAGRKLKIGQGDRILQDESDSDDRSAISKMKRSCSWGSCVGLEHFYRKQGNVLDISHGNHDRKPMLHYRQQEEEVSPLVAIATVDSASDVDCAGSSSILQGIQTNFAFKSRSLNHVTGLTSKVETNEPSMGRRLLTLKGPLVMKRSFSGGRLLGFRGSSRLPL